MLTTLSLLALSLAPPIAPLTTLRLADDPACKDDDATAIAKSGHKSVDMIQTVATRVFKPCTQIHCITL